MKEAGDEWYVGRRTYHCYVCGLRHGGDLLLAGRYLADERRFESVRRGVTSAELTQPVIEEVVGRSPLPIAVVAREGRRVETFLARCLGHVGAQVACKNGASFELLLYLSRACLGKMIAFHLESGKMTVSLTDVALGGVDLKRNEQLPQLGQHSRRVAAVVE